MKLILGRAFLAVGALWALLAVFAAIGAAVALSERMRFGRGLMFADVEFLLILTFVLGVAGVAILWLGIRLVRPAKTSEDRKDHPND